MSQQSAAFLDLAGQALWRARMKTLRTRAASGRAGRHLITRHAIEFMLDRLAGGAAPEPHEQAIAALAQDAVRLARRLPTPARSRLREMVREGLDGEATLVPLFHLLRTAALQRARGFDVHFAGLAGERHDLLITRDGMEAEIACDVVSAEEGRDVHRGAWVRLVDQIDPDLQTWLAAHPGRYLLKLTLPQGLRVADASLPALHARIRDMLASQRRSDHDEAAVLRLDPLMLAASQAGEAGLLRSVREAFGDQAHLALTNAGGSLLVMAARAGREDEISAAIHRRLAAVAPARLSGTRPGIMAILVEDTDAREWRGLRERLELEGEARQFLTRQEARAVVAVSCCSRLELFAATGAAPEGELRFRNPNHPAAKAAALAPSILSSI
ncbi:MAG: hypothetical protein KGK10_01140 [Rhodospirillales bacterium]|nr:hypothetical protein [Rhodospirillales bacterium]